jgi:hypothetical protein
MQQWYQCPRCNSPVSYGTQYCNNCGQPLNWQQPQPPPQQPIQTPHYQQQYQQQQQASYYQHSQREHKQKKTSPWLIGFIAVIAIVLLAAGVYWAIDTGSFTTTLNPQESLRQRASEWAAMLTSLPTSNKEQDLKQIESFIEPSSVRSERAREYYEMWTSEVQLWKAVLFSIDDVAISPDGKYGTVRVSQVVEWIGEEVLGIKAGERKTITQITNWKLIDKTWYRTIEAVEIK